MPHSSRLVDALQSVATQDRSSANHPTDVLRRFTRVAIKNEASLSSMRGFVGPWPGSESAVPNRGSMRLRDRRQSGDETDQLIRMVEHGISYDEHILVKRHA